MHVVLPLSMCAYICQARYGDSPLGGFPYCNTNISNHRKTLGLFRTHARLDNFGGEVGCFLGGLETVCEI